MKKLYNKIIASKYWWAILLILVIALNYLGSFIQARIDLTKEKRYTLSRVTKNMVHKLDDVVQVDVFLKGEFPSGFRKLANTTREFLGLLKDLNSGKIRYRFISPTETVPGRTTTYGDSLVQMGATPINLTYQKKETESSNIIFPSAVVSYKGKQSLVNLYPGANSRISQDETNRAEALMEYQFVKTLDQLTKEQKPGLAYSTGNGEPTDIRTYDLRLALQENYSFGTLDINKAPRIPDQVDLLMIVKPSIPFTEDEKLKIDQFVMRGGKLLCFIDNLIAERDSLALKPETIAYDRNLNLTDLFFKYGLRINTDLVMDLQCDAIPIVVGGTEGNPQLEFLQWNYYPFLLPAGDNITKGLGYVTAQFANSIDTIQVSGVRKEPLLVTSPNSRTISTPALISLNENKVAPADDKFKRNAIPVAMLLEGKFTSLFRNRITKAQSDTLAVMGERFRDASVDNAKMIVAADGDIVLNDFILSGGPNSQPEPIQMGWNKYTYTEYLKQSELGRWFVPVANREFLLNSVEYLVSNPAISETRNKDIVLRLLDSKKINARKTTWQLINIALPVLLVILCGWIYQEVRKRKYTRSVA